MRDPILELVSGEKGEGKSKEGLTSGVVYSVLVSSLPEPCDHRVTVVPHDTQGCDGNIRRSFPDTVRAEIAHTYGRVRHSALRLFTAGGLFLDKTVTLAVNDDHHNTTGNVQKTSKCSANCPL